MNNIFTKIFVFALAIGGFAGTTHAQSVDALGNAPMAYSGYTGPAYYNYGSSYAQSQYRAPAQNYTQNNTAQIVSGVVSLFNAGTQAGLWGNRSSYNSYGSYGNYGSNTRTSNWTSAYGTSSGTATSYGAWNSGSNMSSTVRSSNACAYRDPVLGCLSN